MTYAKGDVVVTRKPCADYERDMTCEHHDQCDLGYAYGAGIVVLPHSCNEWVIGKREDVEAMIADLQDALKKL